MSKRSWAVPMTAAQAALCALEQGVAQQGFEPRQLAAHRGLRAVQQVGRAGGAAGGHHGAEDLDVAVGDAVGQGSIVHGVSISLLNG